MVAIEPQYAFEQILLVARQQRLFGYEAAYLELASRQGIPLATLDEELRRAVRVIGVELVMA